MKDWEAEGKKNWKSNLNKVKERKDKQKYFEDREVNIYKNRL